MTISFAEPWLLLALAALPILWLLIRVLPPPPRIIQFPGVRLLAGLKSEERRPEGAPPWLRFLRLLAVALAMVGLAGPMLDARRPLDVEGPVAILMDGGWASAKDWEARKRAVRDILARAERENVSVFFAVMSRTAPAYAKPEPREAAFWRPQLDSLEPAAWAPDRESWIEWVAEAERAGAVFYWLHDGLDHGYESALADSLPPSRLHVLQSAEPLRAVGAASHTAEGAQVELLRTISGPAERIRIEARDSEERTIAVAETQFESGQRETQGSFELPAPLVNRIATFRIPGERTAAALRLLGDGWRRPRVGIVAGSSGGPEQPLLQGAHYVRSAIGPVSEVVEGEIDALTQAAVQAMVLVDRGELTESERTALSDWVKRGGLLIRFAGPHMARHNERGSETGANELLPVHTVPGGRNLGGALSWTRPQRIGWFAAHGPLAGMVASPDALVSRQLLAAPDAQLSERAWARLEDGTPIVTGAPFGDGELVLFHTTATASWTTLPLTGTFSEMLSRIIRRAGPGSRAEFGEDGPWMLERAVNGYGDLETPEAGIPPVMGIALDTGIPGPAMPPGLYASGEDSRVLSLEASETLKRGSSMLPAGAVFETLGHEQEEDFGPVLLALALLLIAGDTLLVVVLAGGGLRRIASTLPALIFLAVLQSAEADEIAGAAIETTFAYVVTGDPALDRLSRAGLRGLGNTLRARTTVEPAPPRGVDLEFDDLSVIPMLYWPIGSAQTTLSDRAVVSLNQFLKTGGLLILDTRDQATGGDGFGRERLDLVRLAGRLDIPPLTLAGPDHVLTRSYYLLSDFPGRWSGGRIWVARGEEVGSGVVNDGVSPVILGGSDWAAAWAEDETGQPLAVLGGKDSNQREMALRAGVNFVMYALTGNYKADQVHLPAILERLGL